MKPKTKPQNQASFLFQDLLEQLNPRAPLLELSRRIPWDVFEKEFADFYKEGGRPAKPIRLMVGLLILRQMENLSDEKVVEVWVQNPYYQAFCGERVFQWRFPCDPSDLTYFRRRIGEEGVEKIFEVSVRLHGKAAQEDEVMVDTTVQEKNITFPTDAKLLAKVIVGCRAIAAREGVSLRRSFRRELPDLLRQRHKSDKTIRRIRTMAGVLIRELERKMPKEALAAHEPRLALFRRLQVQKRQDKGKLYSLHEPDVACIAKGKAHKKYEFGCKASVAWTKTTGIIVGAKAFLGNPFDGHTLDAALNQVERVTGRRPLRAATDKGYRGRKMVGETEILLPGRPKAKTTAHQRRIARDRFRRRAGIEGVISHLKHDFRMLRNYLKGTLGDSMNVLLACAAYNFKKLVRQLGDVFALLAWLSCRLHDAHTGRLPAQTPGF